MNLEGEGMMKYIKKTKNITNCVHAAANGTTLQG